jgi:DNA-directed RNA polymerase subunit M/transcription elongation factor TFIIS
MVSPKRHQQRTTVIVRGQMRRRLCPQCGSLSGQFLTDESREADVDYYECEHCGETWIVDPMNPTRPQRSMKPPKSRSISLP